MEEHDFDEVAQDMEIPNYEVGNEYDDYEDEGVDQSEGGEEQSEERGSQEQLNQPQQSQQQQHQQQQFQQRPQQNKNVRPNQDFRGGNQRNAPKTKPEMFAVKNFLQDFYQKIHSQDVAGIQTCYESGWNKITDKYFHETGSSWPMGDTLKNILKTFIAAPIVEAGEKELSEMMGEEVEKYKIFMILYHELCFRHIYSHGKPTLKQRFQSFDNYCSLFNYIVNSSTPVPLELPNQWLWDIVDEFIYQFQTFAIFRSKIREKASPEDLSSLNENPQIWNILLVLNVLHSLVDKSSIQNQLAHLRNPTEVEFNPDAFATKPLYKMLGYFSLIGLLRLHCQLGDYYLALDMIKNIELNKKALFTRVTSCYIATFYYVGFCYLMLRRYQDAAKTFSNILYFISRTKQYHSRSFQYNMITKQNDQMYALLAISVCLFPQKIEETVFHTLRDKHGDKMSAIQQGSSNFESIFEELFKMSCPKFISPIDLPTRRSDGGSLSQEPTKHQLKIFLREVRQQTLIPIIRSYLKLYSTMDVSKLASFLEIDKEKLVTILVCYKHKTRQKKWESGAPLEGEYASLTDVNFYLKDDMIHISERKQMTKYADFFIRNISKFEDVIENWSLVA